MKREPHLLASDGLDRLGIVSAAKLTPREFEVLGHIIKGDSSKDAARALGISPRTAEFHCQNVMRKFGMNRKTELIFHIAWESGVQYEKTRAERDDESGPRSAAEQLEQAH